MIYSPQTSFIKFQKNEIDHICQFQKANQNEYRTQPLPHVNATNIHDPRQDSNWIHITTL